MGQQVMDASDQPSVSMSMEVDIAPIDECKESDDGALIHADGNVNKSPSDSLLYAHHDMMEI